jgi:hypothetical protein
VVLKLTAAEKALVLRERERLELESRDWAKELFVTDKQLMLMSPRFRELFSSTPLLWRYDERSFAYSNTVHPDNQGAL